MNTRIASFRALRALVSGAVLTTLGFLVVSSARAAAVTSWTKTSGGSVISGLNTANLVFGDGTTDSGDGYQVNAALPSAYTLSAVGDSITFSGSATFTLTSAGAGSDQFRIGLFDTNGSSNTNGWRGYFATNSGIGGNPNGRLWERKETTTTAYFNNDITLSADERQAFAGSPASTASASTFLSGTYSFSLAATRTATGLSVVWSIVRADGNNYAIGGTYNDTTPNTYIFDRVGIMSGGGLNADLVSFSNLDATFVSAVPEPSSFAALAAAAVLGSAVLRRRART